MDRYIRVIDNLIYSIESAYNSESEEYSSTESEHSVISESNCFRYHTDEPSTTNVGLAKSKKPVNLLQKLYFREIRGSFSPHPRAPRLRLFNSVPAENKICLKHVLPESAFHTNHVFLGLSKCGRFLLSYTHSIELDVIIFNNVHKYRLHWWSFVPHQRARKVAEVMLFGNQGVYCDLDISVCQWPIDTTKLLIYGYCVHTDHCQFGHSHLTITTVPSLNTCRDCLKVAASYEEEDLAAIWDSCVRFSCLKHGLTIHSNFDVVSPYPTFNPQVSMKRDGVVVFNTGNFLHLLRADLESFGGAGIREAREGAAPGAAKGAVGAAPLLGEFLDACDGAPPRQQAQAPGGRDDRPFWSVLEEVRISEPAAQPESDSQDAFASLVGGRSASRGPEGEANPPPSGTCEAPCPEERAREQPARRADALTMRERAVRDFQDAVFSGRAAGPTPKARRPRAREDPAPGEDVEWSRSVSEKIGDTISGYSKDFVPPSVEGPDAATAFDSSMELSIACGGGDEAGAPCPARRQRRPRGGLVRIGSSPPASAPRAPDLAAETVYDFTDDPPDNSEKLSSFRRRRLAEKKYEFCEEEGEDAENIVPFRLTRGSGRGGEGPVPRLRSPPALAHGPRSPDGAAGERGVPAGAGAVPPLEQDKAVLRPLNRNPVAITLLSPREAADKDWTKASVRKVPPMEAAAADTGCLSDSVPCQKGPREEAAQPPGGGLGRYKCTVQFKRRYIEVDDELVSTTTDIEDEDCTGAAPYHFALPLEIHGAGYVQLQMISNSKAEKLMGGPGVVVHQMSFDVEAFCHEVAQRLCEAAGKKYCFCVDYDVEIIDVCIITGDVLVLAIMRIEAMVLSKGLAKSLRCGEVTASGQRNQYQGGCTFVWSTETGTHRVVATSPLIESSAMDDTQEPWGPAKSHVHTLREALPQVPMCHPVRSITNRPVFSEESYKCLSDLDNLISLVL